jgi:ribosomal protein S18 acetylase RimI-like enzyme
VGFGQLRAGAAPAGVGGRSPREIYRLYVAEAWHGRGVAQPLMRRLIEQALGSGADGVWLGVWEHNPRAIAFYRKSGFVEVGEHTFVLGTDRQRDLVMQYRGVPP